MVLLKGRRVYYLFFLGCFFFKKSVKTAVPEDGRPPGALVSTKLVEWYRLEVEQIFFCCPFLCFFLFFGLPSGFGSLPSVSEAARARRSGRGTVFSQNGGPGRREAPQSIKFDETSRMKSVWARWIFGTFFSFFAKLNQLGLCGGGIQTAASG